MVYTPKLPTGLLEELLSAALGRGAEMADIYAEQSGYTSVISDDRKINTSARQEGGVGIRVVSNQHTYYAVAASDNPKDPCESPVTLNGRPSPLGPQFVRELTEIGAGERLETVRANEELAWSGEERVRQVSIRYSDHQRDVQIASSHTSEVIEHTLGLTEYSAAIYAGADGDLQMGTFGRAVYGGPEEFKGDDSFEEVTLRARRNALHALDADEAPRGVMPVVFEPGENGVLFHEACGHGMEADLVERGSAFAGKMGEPVASELVTLIDDGTIPHAPGSYGVDDEGVAAKKTTMIREGVLESYLHSIVTASREGVEPTGSARRQDYRYPPIPRMRNTYIDQGDTPAADIIAQTERGLFAQEMGWGGQVDVVTGRFTTGVQLAWLIENGKLVRPVKGATLSGVGIETLKNIDMVGDDLDVVRCSGRCGKGQAVPIGVGMPTVRVSALLVGGSGEAVQQ